MMYASKIVIEYKKQKIRYTRSVQLPDGLLDIQDISKHLKKGEKFGFHQSNDVFNDEQHIIIHGVRDETNEEYKTRIAKQESYNENYDKFQLRKQTTTP